MRNIQKGTPGGSRQLYDQDEPPQPQLDPAMNFASNTRLRNNNNNDNLRKPSMRAEMDNSMNNSSIPDNSDFEAGSNAGGGTDFNDLGLPGANKISIRFG